MLLFGQLHLSAKTSTSIIARRLGGPSPVAHRFPGLDASQEALEVPVPRIAADIVDAYVFRRLNGRTQFLLLRRSSNVTLPGSWQSVHGTIEPNESALDAAKRAVSEKTGLDVVDAFSADYVNQFYDHHTDTLVLAPVFAFIAPPKSRITDSE
jgi:8-oxo-dGTP pyrophosphatase MutT (NUDIX family)